MPFSMEEYEKFNKKTENAYYNNNNNVIYLFGNNSNINADIFVDPYYYKQHPIFGQFNYTNNTSNISPNIIEIFCTINTIPYTLSSALCILSFLKNIIVSINNIIKLYIVKDILNNSCCISILYLHFFWRIST